MNEKERKQMNLQIYPHHFGTYLQRIVDVQQMASICLVARDAAGCAVTHDAMGVAHRAIHRWIAQTLFGTGWIHQLRQFVQVLPLRRSFGTLRFLKP